MPKEQCTKDGKTGVRWGKHGSCYTGKNKDYKMNQQRKAIERSKHLRKG